MTEGIFDMSNVGILKEIEKKKMGDVYTLLCLRSAGLSKAFGLRNLCYSKISVVMLLGYMIVPGRVAQSVTCLATDASLPADPGVASSIPARDHTFVEIDHEIISTVMK